MLYHCNQKTKELRPRACKPSKTHARNEVPSHKKHLRQLGIQRKKGRGPSNYRVWKRKHRVIRSRGAAVCLSGSFLSLSCPLSPHTPLFLSLFLSSSSLCFGRAPPAHGLERPALWVCDRWDLATAFEPGPASLFSSADGRVWAPKKQRLKERPERFWRHECPRTRGVCGHAEIRGPSLWGVSRLACGEAKLKSSRAAGRVKGEGFAEKPRLAGAGFDTSYL